MLDATPTISSPWQGDRLDDTSTITGRWVHSTIVTVGGYVVVHYYDTVTTDDPPPLCPAPGVAVRVRPPHYQAGPPAFVAPARDRAPRRVFVGPRATERRHRSSVRRFARAA